MIPVRDDRDFRREGPSFIPPFEGGAGGGLKPFGFLGPSCGSFPDPAFAGGGEKGRGRRGFTLVEMLVALGVFSVIAVSLAASLKHGIDTWRRIEAESRRPRLAKALFSEVSRELRHAVPFPVQAVELKGDSLRFHTVRASLPGAAAGDIVEVEYRLNHLAGVKTERGGPFLEKVLRRVSARGVEENKSALLTREPTEIVWEAAFIPSEKDGPIRWKSEWTQGNDLPAGLRMTLSFQEEGAVFQRVFDVPGGILGTKGAGS